ncbi:MAG: Hsp70 family protein [Microbacterium sp.]|uniref:Hsp70 family protein n=1 Tax=Microbacterium sp. TaxID=51671 RepID=UPI003F958C69
MSNWDFALAIDIGNSRVVSAIARVTRSEQTQAAVFSFSNNEHSATSAVFVDSDGSLSFADEAERRGRERPERLVREFAHQMGDDVPVMVGEYAIRAEDLYARMCAWIISVVTVSEGAAPAVIAITVPTAWGGHRRAAIAAALERAGVSDAVLLSEAESVARHYELSHPLQAGQMLAVYDLGGTKFDALVLRKRIAAGVGSQPIGEQVHINDLGGANFDELLLRQVMATAGALASNAGDELPALATLQREVVKAKETLSSEADATLQLEFSSGPATVRINRSEFEALIDDPLEQTLDALDLAVESAGIDANKLEAILLTGGSSRIPLVAQRLSERFNRPLVAEDDPKATVALGAAHIAWDRLHDGITPRSAVALVEDAASAAPSTELEAMSVASGTSSAGSLTVQRPPARKSWWSKSPILITTAAAFIACAIVFSNSTAAGSRWPDFIQTMSEEATSLVDPLILQNFSTPASGTSESAVESAEAGGPPASRDRSASRERTVPRDADEPMARSRGLSETDTVADGPRKTPKSPSKPSKPSGPKAEPSGPPVDASTPSADTTPADVTPPRDTTPPGDTTPADPAPPVDTTPDAPASPVDTTPVDPAPTDTTPVDPTPTDPAPVEPSPPDPAPADTTPADPIAPVATTPPAEITPFAQPADPAPAEPAAPSAVPAP